jgi:hypothetical protein
MPRICLRVTRYDLDCRIELLPDLAPATAAALAAALPAEGLVTTDAFYGSNICLRLPDFPRQLPLENPTIFPAPGDVFIFQSAHGAELVVFYQRMGGSVPAGTPFDAVGAKAGSRVGAVTNLTPALVESATRLWSEGAAWGMARNDLGLAMRAVRNDVEAAQHEIELRRVAWLCRTERDHMGQPPAAGPRVSLTIAEYSARTIVQLATDRAPHTCDAILSRLPISLTLMHGRYSGPEVFTHAPEVGQYWNWAAKPENSIACPLAGDMVLYVDPPPRIQLNYFHDRGSIPYGVSRPEIGNLVGSSVGDFGHFAEACWRLAFEGWKTLHVERAE